MPSSTTALAAAAFCSYVYPARLPSMVSSTPLPNARYICRHLLTAASGTDSLFAAAARPEPSAKSSAASLLVSASCFTLRSMRTRKPPISRAREMGGGSGFRSRPLVAQPNARRLGFYGEGRERERGHRGGPPAAPPRPSPRYAGRAPSTGQRRPALPRADPAVPSALGGLASGFGMGPGVPRPPWPLTGGRRSSCDVETASHVKGWFPRALGAAQRAQRIRYPDRPELHPPSTCSCARGDATGKSSGD